MAKVLTGNEYLPPLPDRFPAHVFRTLEEVGGIALSPELREEISSAAYLLVDAVYRHEAAANATLLRKRVERVNHVLANPNVSGEAMMRTLRPLFESIEIGEALRDALFCPSRGLPYPHVHTPAAWEGRREALRQEASSALVRLQAAHADQRGPEPLSFVDLFIQRMKEIFAELGGVPSAAYCAIRGNRLTPFVELVCAVAAAAMDTFWSGDIPNQVRWALQPGALAERTHVVLNPTARVRRAARADRYKKGRRNSRL